MRLKHVSRLRCCHARRWLYLSLLAWLIATAGMAGETASRSKPEVAVGQAAPAGSREPQTAKVEVTREGRLLTLDYQLLDAQGRDCIDRKWMANAPRFTILQAGREIGAGSFEYG